MKLRYLQTSAAGLQWMRNYYLKNPQLDRRLALARLKQAEDVLREFPESGKLYEDFENVREFRVLGTQFSLLYTVAEDHVWIIDVRDPRGNRSAEALRTFLNHLYALNGLISDEG